MFAHALQAAAGAHETMSNHYLLRYCMLTLAHVQRHVLQTAAGVNKTLLNFSSDRPLHSLFRSRMSTLAHVQRHAPQTAAGAHEAMLRYSSLPAFSYASVVIDGRCQASDAPE